MLRYALVVLAFVVGVAWAGDEFWTPLLRDGSAYESKNPKFRVVGVEDRGSEHTVYVVADPPDVLAQRRVNSIIRDIRKRVPDCTEISFYLAVKSEPQFPAFAIYDHIGIYLANDNMIHYGVASGTLYGGWAYGPGG